mgnify:CR=1 FL=1
MEQIKSILFMLTFLSLNVFAEEITTNNLITNGTFNNGTNGWTLSGNAVRIGDCCPGGHDLEFGDSGSIEQSFDLLSNTITQPMLDNGITLNSSVEVQNGECGVAQCWGGQGPADSFSIRLQIKDSEDNILATTTQERTNVTGINGKDFEDSVSFTGTGSNRGNIFISASDSNSPATLGGPNVDNISVTMTYDNTVLTATQTAELTTTFQEIVEVIEIVEEIIPETFEELFIEEVVLEELIFEVLPEIIETNEEEKFIEETIVLEIYEEPKTEQEVATEIESEEIVLAEEQTGIEEISETEETNSAEEQSTPVDSNEETSVATTNEENNERVNNESQQDNNVVSINVEKIAEKVAEKVKSVDQQLKITQIIVAKAMNNNRILDSYNNINQDIFNNQPIIDGGNYYETTKLIDNRNIYSQNQNIYNDLVAHHQEQVQQAVDEVIRTEQHLREIRGY